MGYDAKTEQIGRDLVYLIQTNESMQLSDKSLHDIFFRLRDLAAYYQEDTKRVRKENFAKKFNETRLWTIRNKEATRDDILKIMELTKKDISVRSVTLDDLRWE